MKIAIDCRMYGSSGIGTYIREILPYMIKTEDNFLLIGKKEELEKFKDLKNVEIKECDISIFSLKELFLFPTKEINKCDAFYTPFHNIPGKIKVPIYSTIHDVLFLDMPELTSKFGYIIRKIFYKRAYYLSKKIFTVSNFSKSRIQKTMGNKKEIIVTYNGISQYLLDNKKKYIKKDYFIFVGNIKKHKGLKTLLLAYKEARKEGLKTELIIVGSQKNFKTKDTEIIKILEEAKQEGIVFTGYVDNEKLKQLIGEAKALIQPSLYEGFGIPPLEALELGTQAIVSDIEVFKEIYQKLDVEFFKVDSIIELKKKMLELKIKDITNNSTYFYKDCFNKIISNINKGDLSEIKK